METTMTPVERQMLAGLFERVASTAATPRDPEAEAFINDNLRAQPHAPYVLSQTVLVQQQALENAARRVQELEAQVKAQAHEETSFLGNLGKSLFGGGASAPSAPPRPSYDASAYARQPDPGYGRPQQAYPPQQPGPWGAPQAPAGGGFLQSALTTATGVAGGVVLANALGGLFGGHSGGLFGGGVNPGFGGGETINNFYETAPDAAGLHAQDVLQDQDQDQDDAQDAQDAGYDSSGDDSSFDFGGSFDT
jgi:uncharacterized protein